MCLDKEISSSLDSRNYIVETVKRIDRMQKEISLDEAANTISCETSLIRLAFNTVPITFYCSCAALSATLDVAAATTTQQFRIESIKQDRFVTLRLIDSATATCTNQTIIYDLNCCCGIQCFEPIQCNFNELP